MRTMKTVDLRIRIVNNHVLGYLETKFGERPCLVGTGVPQSFLYEGDEGERVLDRKPYRRTPLGRIPIRDAGGRGDVERLVGTRVDGFIGTDSMERCGNVLLDFPGRAAHFGVRRPRVGQVQAMESVMGLPVFSVALNGRELRAAFDSGSMYSFLGSDIAADMGLAPAHRTIGDFHPGHGEFGVELHRASVSACGVHLGVHEIGTAGRYDDVLGRMGVEAFIGIESLRSSRVFLSYASGEVSIW